MSTFYTAKVDDSAGDHLIRSHCPVIKINKVCPILLEEAGGEAAVAPVGQKKPDPILIDASVHGTGFLVRLKAVLAETRGGDQF